MSPFTARQRIFDEEESELDMSVFANHKGGEESRSVALMTESSLSDQIEELAYKQVLLCYS